MWRYNKLKGCFKILQDKLGNWGGKKKKDLTRQTRDLFGIRVASGRRESRDDLNTTLGAIVWPPYGFSHVVYRAHKQTTRRHVCCTAS
jgi:hypothetical protein